MKRITKWMASTLFLSILVLGTLPLKFSLISYAASSTVSVDNRYYEFGENSKYEIDDATSNGKTSAPLGNLNLSGEMESISSVNGFTAYEVKKDTITFNYSMQSTYSNSDEFQWHIIDDKSKDVNGDKIENNILKGTIIVQTSLTGDNWITDVVYTDIGGEEGTFSSDFYSSKPIQQVNGCYYRILVVYKLERRIDDSKIGFITTKNYERKKCAEVYSFYLIDNSESRSKATSPDSTPRKELGTKINTGKDNGYSGNVAINNKDPHFGWDIGTFFVNGYTRETVDSSDSTPIFIKNLDDRVTLWFNLSQDINALNGNSNIVVASNKKGYDQYFEVPKTDFRHGTLIIRFTDYEGVKHEPIIYTDYLAASTRTGANTMVELFEEGDYEVSLDYEIEDKSGIVSSYSDYKIFFKFKIRNGNCMVFPFDISSNSELNDFALTANGFRLDMAKSRYLTIDVERFVVKENNGVFTLDSRFNRPAKDGDSYTDEGMYVFTVKNLYTGANSTTKTIYVGSRPIYKALSRGCSLDEINTMLADGGTLEDDGSITMPVIEEPSPEVIIEDQNIGEKNGTKSDAAELENNKIKSDVAEIENNKKESTVSQDVGEFIQSEVNTGESQRSKSSGVYIVIFVVVLGASIGGGLFWKRKKLEKSMNSDEDNEGGDQ